MKYRIVMAVLGTMLALAAAAQPKVVAHRGYWRHAGSAQNSLAAFNKADSIGVYGAEIDVWMTADGRLVVNHARYSRAWIWKMIHTIPFAASVSTTVRCCLISMSICALYRVSQERGWCSK